MTAKLARFGQGTIQGVNISLRNFSTLEINSNVKVGI